MKPIQFIIRLMPLLYLCSCGTKNTKGPDNDGPKPNIIIMYVDDLGYGDIGVNGAVGVETPNIDRLAGHGINFTDAHCSAATCTPSRYSLLTGSYAFRNNAAILPGDAPLIIDPDKGTLPAMLQQAGYETAVIGKWHLGLGRGQVNWNKKVQPGPGEIGFDYSFLIPATADRVPCVYLENQRIAGLSPDDPVEVNYNHKMGNYPTGTENPELLKMKADTQHSQTIVNGISRIGFMKGGKKALWKDEDFPMILTAKAKAFMRKKRGQPFFLYFAFSDIHVPRVPNPKFAGKSSMGPRGDAIAQMDWCVGQLVAELEKLEVSKNTLIIFTSDNGPVLNDGYDDQAVGLLGEHQPAGPFRGGKYSAYEAGTRMPTIVYWPGTVAPGESHALLSQVDLYASLAHLAGQELATEDAPDSFDFLDAWLGRTDTARQTMLEESFTLAVRDGNWKYIHPQEKEAPDWLDDKMVEKGLSDDVMLYNLINDPGEQRNVASQYPKVVDKMSRLLEKYRKENHSRPVDNE